jgi:predicted transcriptional regulator
MKAGICGVLPATDTQKKVVGIITHRDICLAMSEDATTPSENVPVSEIMHTHVHTVKESANMDEALKQMRSNHIGRLPVADENGRLAGILSLHHVIAKAGGTKANFGVQTNLGGNLLKTIQALGKHYEKHGRTEIMASAW